MNVSTLCLGILSFQEASGYEIKKMAEDGMFSHFIEASFGSIYPALTRMLDAGFVTVREQEQDGRPGKKVYSITPEGRAQLTRSLCDFPARDKFKSEFLFQLLLMDNISAQHLGEVFDRHIALVQEEFDHVCACEGAGGEHTGLRFVNGYGQAVLSAGLAYLKSRRDDILQAAQSATPRTGKEAAE